MKNEDLISRQAAAIDAVHYEYDSCCNIDESGSAIADDIERIIDNVPSAAWHELRFDAFLDSALRQTLLRPL